MSLPQGLGMTRRAVLWRFLRQPLRSDPPRHCTVARLAFDSLQPFALPAHNSSAYDAPEQRLRRG